MFDKTRNEERRRLLGPREEQEREVLTEAVLTCRQSTLVEPVIFVFMMAKTLSDTVIINLLENRICRVDLGLPEANCSEPISPQVEDILQPTTAQIIMGRSLLEALVPSCLTVLIGPWSDDNGRKPFIVIALAGMSLAYWCWGFLALMSNLNPYFFLLASLPFSGSGGSWALIMLSYCYISDVTEESTRKLRMSVLTMVFYFSFIVGTSLAPLLMAAQHSPNPYPLIFFLSASLLLLSALYTHRWLRESVDVELGGETKFFRCSHVKDSLLTCFQRRGGHARTMILLIIVFISLNIFLFEGESAVMYLSLREMFSWQLSDFSIFNCFLNITSGVGAILGVWLFTSLLGLPNMLVVALLMLTRVARSLLMALARSSLHVYVANAVATFVSTYSPLCRTEISRMVPKQDLGKVFAVMTFLESFTPIAATPLYTLIYRLSFQNSPGTIYFFSAAVSLAAVLLATIVYIMQRIVKGACYCVDLTNEYHVQTVD